MAMSTVNIIAAYGKQGRGFDMLPQSWSEHEQPVKIVW